jgi:hypothetical protein
VETPAFSPASGIYKDSVTVSISCATSGAVIHYTTDGSEPNKLSKVYSAPLTFNNSGSTVISTTLNAKAFKDDYTPSETARGVYIITPPTPVVETPTFTPAPGTYSLTVQIIMSCATSGAEIHYTTDGTEPTRASQTYSTPVRLMDTTTLKAKAFLTGYTPSETATGEYTITPLPVVETPTFTPAPGTYSLTVQVIISCATSGAEIHYTLDGTEPTQTSQTYSTPVRLINTRTLKARAFLAGYTPSETATGEYTITHVP